MTYTLSTCFLKMNAVFYGLVNMLPLKAGRPEMFGFFHMTVLLAAVAAAVTAAVLFARRIRRSDDPEASLIRVLLSTGWLLAALELFKQLYLYFAVNGGAYDWWFFPFQLCSVPMYLCVLLPFVKRSIRGTFITFMGGYTFVSAIAALVYPEDFIGAAAPLAAHGFIWHALLLFISLLILILGKADASAKGLLRAALLFAVLCVTAVSINVLAQPSIDRILASHPGIPHSYAAMFYLDPAHISAQPVVSSVQMALGVPAGLVLYALTIAAVSSLVIICSSAMTGKKRHD